MENKTLQLKDICGYLPYGLKCQGMGEWEEGEDYVDESIPKIFTMSGICTDSNGERYVEGMYGNDMHAIYFPDDFFPILYPIDYLYKPITHKGKEIIPIVELAKITMQDAIRKEYWKPEDFVLVGNQVKLGNYTFFYEKRECFSWSYKYSDLNDQTALYQLQLFDLCHELKIDIRGLIPQGLAVSVDELEVNPYK